MCPLMTFITNLTWQVQGEHPVQTGADPRHQGREADPVPHPGQRQGASGEAIIVIQLLS